MNVYANILFLHFLGMAGLFIGYGLEWTASSALRKATTAQNVRTWLGAYRLSLPLSGPALLLLILTGGYMAGTTGNSSAGWILATAVGIVIALGIGFGMLMPRMKAIKSSLPPGDTAISAETLARVQNPAIVTLIRVRAFLALGIVYLMTTKPPIGTSFAVLVVAAIVGVLFSASAWSKKTA
jgi:hypothetical protein